MPTLKPTSFVFHPHTLALCVAIAGACAPAFAQTQMVAAAGLKEVVISGSCNELDPDELPAIIDVLNRKQIEERQIRDVVRDLPNVSVQRSPARFGLAAGNTGGDQNSGFNIRGLDGIRQPRNYVFSANAFGRDYLDIDQIQRVEAVRGATAAL